MKPDSTKTGHGEGPAALEASPPGTRGAMQPPRPRFFRKILYREPLLRSKLHEPRAEALRIGRMRRLLNVASDLVEIAAWPVARIAGRRLGIEEVAVPVRGLHEGLDGYRIAFLTDFHASPIVSRSWLDEAVSLANDVGADIVALGGDFVSSHARHVWSVADALSRLRAPDGVVGVLGNHDHNVGADLVRRALEGAGVALVENRSRVVARGGGRVAFGGVGDLISDAIDFVALAEGIGPEVPRVVLSHHPDVFALWPPDLRIDLMLSGHTHGGQARLPFLDAPYVPSHFGYAEGLIEEGGRRLYVSRGVGALLVPFRWGCPPEVTAITLRAAP